MATVPAELPMDVRNGLDRLGLAEIGQAFIGAGADFVEAEQAFRQRGRLQAIRADNARVEPLQGREERENAAGIRQMNRALESFERGRGQLNQKVRKQIDEALGSQGFKDRLAEARDEFYDLIADADISGAEAEEVVQMWDEAQATLEQEGFDGLLSRGQRMAREARDARERPNRGREPHSPLATWKYAIIAGTIVVGVAAIIACFIWFACSWVVAMLKFLGTPVSGWILLMIQQGCAPIPLPQE
jgi:hypothetical protein